MEYIVGLLTVISIPLPIVGESRWSLEDTRDVKVAWKQQLDLVTSCLRV